MDIKLRLLLSLLLSLLWLGAASAQELSITSIIDITSTVALTPTPSTSLTASTSSSTLLTTPTPSPPATTSCDPVPQTCSPPPEPAMPLTPVIALVALLIVSLVACAILVFILSWICYRKRRDNTEIKKYVFEEGVTAPGLWVESGPVEEKVAQGSIPNNWEATTFTPSPQSKNTTMPLPDPQNDSIQPIPNGTEISRGNKKIIQPVPVPPVQVKTKFRFRPKRIAPPPPKMSKFRPKRIAPPPPKMSKRKKMRRTKCEDDSVVYSVPSPCFTAAPPTQNGGGEYDVPRTRSNKWRMPHIYKSINVSKVKGPNTYADVGIRQN